MLALDVAHAALSKTHDDPKMPLRLIQTRAFRTTASQARQLFAEHPVHIQVWHARHCMTRHGYDWCVEDDVSISINISNTIQTSIYRNHHHQNASKHTLIVMEWSGKHMQASIEALLQEESVKPHRSAIFVDVGQASSAMKCTLCWSTWKEEI